MLSAEEWAIIASYLQLGEFTLFLNAAGRQFFPDAVILAVLQSPGVACQRTSGLSTLLPQTGWETLRNGILAARWGGFGNFADCVVRPMKMAIHPTVVTSLDVQPAVGAHTVPVLSALSVQMPTFERCVAVTAIPAGALVGQAWLPAPVQQGARLLRPGQAEHVQAWYNAVAKTAKAHPLRDRAPGSYMNRVQLDGRRPQRDGEHRQYAELTEQAVSSPRCYLVNVRVSQSTPGATVAVSSWPPTPGPVPHVSLPALPLAADEHLLRHQPDTGLVTVVVESSSSSEEEEDGRFRINPAIAGNTYPPLRPPPQQPAAPAPQAARVSVSSAIQRAASLVGMGGAEPEASPARAAPAAAAATSTAHVQLVVSTALVTERFVVIAGCRKLAEDVPSVHGSRVPSGPHNVALVYDLSCSAAPLPSVSARDAAAAAAAAHPMLQCFLAPPSHVLSAGSVPIISLAMVQDRPEPVLQRAVRAGTVQGRVASTPLPRRGTGMVPMATVASESRFGAQAMPAAQWAPLAMGQYDGTVALWCALRGVCLRVLHYGIPLQAGLPTDEAQQLQQPRAAGAWCLHLQCTSQHLQPEHRPAAPTTERASLPAVPLALAEYRAMRAEPTAAHAVPGAPVQACAYPAQPHVSAHWTRTLDQLIVTSGHGSGQVALWAGVGGSTVDGTQVCKPTWYTSPHRSMPHTAASQISAGISTSWAHNMCVVGAFSGSLWVLRARTGEPLWRAGMVSPVRDVPAAGAGATSSQSRLQLSTQAGGAMAVDWRAGLVLSVTVSGQLGVFNLASGRWTQTLRRVVRRAVAPEEGLGDHRNVLAVPVQRLRGADMAAAPNMVPGMQAVSPSEVNDADEASDSDSDGEGMCSGSPARWWRSYTRRWVHAVVPLSRDAAAITLQMSPGNLRTEDGWALPAWRGSEFAETLRVEGKSQRVRAVPSVPRQLASAGSLAALSGAYALIGSEAGQVMVLAAGMQAADVVAANSLALHQQHQHRGSDGCVCM